MFIIPIFHIILCFIVILIGQSNINDNDSPEQYCASKPERTGQNLSTLLIWWRPSRKNSENESGEYSNSDLMGNFLSLNFGANRFFVPFSLYKYSYSSCPTLYVSLFPWNESLTMVSDKKNINLTMNKLYSAGNLLLLLCSCFFFIVGGGSEAEDSLTFISSVISPPSLFLYLYL